MRQSTRHLEDFFLWWFFYGPLYLAVACSTLLVLEEYSSPIFWEITPGYVVFSASWFDIGYMFMSFYGGVGLFTEFLREGGTRTLRSVRTCHATLFLRLLVSGSHLFDVVLEYKIRYFLEDPFRKRSRVQRLLVQHWIQVYVSLQRPLEYLTCRARRRHGQWYVLAGFARHDTPHAVFPSIVGVDMPVVMLDSLVQTVQRPVEAPKVQFLARLWMCLSLCNDRCVVRWCRPAVQSSTSLSCRRDSSPWSRLFGRP